MALRTPLSYRGMTLAVHGRQDPGGVLWQPRLVLGVSDEIPPAGDIERVRMVRELV